MQDLERNFGGESILGGFLLSVREWELSILRLLNMQRADALIKNAWQDERRSLLKVAADRNEHVVIIRI